MMSHNQGFREIGVHTLHLLTQGFHLFRCARVRRTALRVKPAFVADADAVAVMSCTVGAHLVEPASRLYSSVPADDEMVANGLIALRPVPQVYVPGTAPLPRTDSRAMDDNKRYGSHLTQLVAPNAVSMAARMLITVWMANLQSSLFL